MARTPAQTSQLVAKALKADSKSDGMRMLLDAGQTVAQVKEAFGVPYGFAYGVASRWAAATGNPIPVAPREAKAKPAKAAKAAKATTAKVSAKAPARSAAKAKAGTASKGKAKAKA